MIFHCSMARWFPYIRVQCWFGQLSGLLIFVAAAVEVSAQHALEVVIAGATPAEGQVVVALFSSPQSYLAEPIAEQMVEVGESGVAIVEFTGLVTGRYAMSAFHDVNENARLDTGFLGIPKERFGFSNDARARFGPAPWDAAAFELSSDRRIDVTLRSIVGR